MSRRFTVLLLAFMTLAAPLAQAAGLLPGCTPATAPPGNPNLGWSAKGLTSDVGRFPVGLDMVAMLRTAGNGDKSKAYAQGYWSSGAKVPVKRLLAPGTRLEKIVPAGSLPSAYTGYWATVEVIDREKAMPTLLADHFALPPSSVAADYDIYAITAKSPVSVFRSPIAPAENTTTCVIEDGGAEQTLVLDRAKFDTPVKVGEIRE